MTKSKLFFPIFVFSGLTVIIIMMINIKVDVVKAYDLTVSGDGTGYVLTFEEKIDARGFGDIFAYEIKNEAVYRLKGVFESSAAGNDGDKTVLLFVPADGAGTELLGFLDDHTGERIKADVPVRKINLLERIFSRGGADN